jgi:hypothetical protein
VTLLSPLLGEPVAQRLVQVAAQSARPERRPRRHWMVSHGGMLLSLFQKLSGKTRLGLRGLEVVVLLLGGVGLYVGRNYVAIQFLGYLAIGIGVMGVPARGYATRRVADSVYGPPRRPGLWLWMVSIISIFPALGSYLYMYSDEARGGQASWPINLTLSLVLLCLLCWFVLLQSLERYWMRRSDFDLDAPE